MHDKIRAQANGAGFHESDGTLVILACGVEDTKTILSTMSSVPFKARSPPPKSAQSSSQAQQADDIGHPFDTIISVLTLCTIPDPQNNLRRLVRDVLKPGGQLLYYEHVLSPRPDVAWWQKLWAPLWAVAFDGCRIDRPSDIWVKDMKLGGEDGIEKSAWKEFRTWGKDGEDPENLFWHSVGRFVKR